MNLKDLIKRSFLYYFRPNIIASAGIAVATAMITGAFIIGDSLEHSLVKTVDMRLGNISHSITAGERLFTVDLGNNFAGRSGVTVSAGLMTEGSASAEGGRDRLPNVQVLGVDSHFNNVLGTGFEYYDLEAGEVIISKNLASRLSLEEGDFFLLRMKRASVIPMNTPFVTDADQSLSRRVEVAGIAKDEDYGRFNMRVSQTAPYNVFVNVDWLNSFMDLGDKRNIVFIPDEGLSREIIVKHLRASWELEDINLSLSRLPGQGYWEISSGRVFINDYVSGRINELFPGSKQHLTYFVNSLEKGENNTPYSFVTAASDFPYGPGEAIVSSWLADDLSVEVGDSLDMYYYETGPLRELTEKKKSFLIKGVAGMEEIEGDSVLMPHLPGLSDAGNCRDWDAGVPVELDRIRPVDEDYWSDYKGTPKAYVSVETGQRLWSNRFGDLTSIWIKDTSVSEEDSNISEEDIRNITRDNIDPLQMGFRVNNPREAGISAATGGVDFGMLFGGLGFFVMISGVIIFVLLLRFNIERRSGQIKIFSSMGFSKKLVRKIYLGEGMIIAFTGTVIGVLLAVLYGKIVFAGLNTVWHDIVRTDLLEIMIKPSSLVMGLVVGLFIAFIVIVISLNKIINRLTNGNQKIIKAGGEPKSAMTRLIVAITIAAGALMLFIYNHYIINTETGPLLFLIAGGLLLLSFLVLADAVLIYLESRSYHDISMAKLSIKNLVRNRSRSFSVITLLSLGMFVVITTGSHRNDARVNGLDRSGGTGGFLFVAESTVPILRNLDDRETRLYYNLPADVDFVQFHTNYGDDASCLNLNKVTNPRILAADLSRLEGRFNFVKGSPWLDEDQPWLSLEKSFDGLVPAVADQAVIQWGLEKNVGDTLFYTNEKGEEFGLLLIGGLENSVFQGNVIISAGNFIKHFPTSSGTNFFLADADHDRKEELQDELEFVFRDYGWNMTGTVERLNTFNAVENTYLGIFMVLGAFGILLGTVGLAVVMARSIMERKNEIALYKSLGYTGKHINKLISREYIVLLITGMMAGLTAALTGSFYSLFSGTQQVDLGFLAALIAIIFLNGILWILIISINVTKNIKVIEALRND